LVRVERAAARRVDGILVIGENGPGGLTHSEAALGSGTAALDGVTLLLGLVNALEAARLSTPEAVGLVCTVLVSEFE
jgi:hypothetical protein